MYCTISAITTAAPNLLLIKAVSSIADLRCARPLSFTDVYQEWATGVKLIVFAIRQTVQQLFVNARKLFRR